MVASFVLWLSTPEKIDMAQVPLELKELQRPFRSIGVDYYLDGGSIDIDILDARGKRRILGLPVEKDEPSHTYIKLAISDNPKRRLQGEMTVSLNDDTRRWIISVLEEANGPERDVALVVFGKSKSALAKDYAKVFWRMVPGQ